MHGYVKSDHYNWLELNNGYHSISAAFFNRLWREGYPPENTWLMLWSWTSIQEPPLSTQLRSQEDGESFLDWARLISKCLPSACQHSKAPTPSALPLSSPPLSPVTFTPKRALKSAHFSPSPPPSAQSNLPPKLLQKPRNWHPSLTGQCQWCPATGSSELIVQYWGIQGELVVKLAAVYNKLWSE